MTRHHCIKCKGKGTLTKSFGKGDAKVTGKVQCPDCKGTGDYLCKNDELMLGRVEYICWGGYIWSLTYSETGPPDQRMSTGRHCPLCHNRVFTTRPITREECGWLEADIPEDSVFYRYDGPTSGVIAPEDIAVSKELNKPPFFGLPKDAFVYQMRRRE